MAASSAAGLTSAAAEHESLLRRRFLLCGQVQGRGVRPLIFRWASALGLAGSVRNTRRGVEIEAIGNPRQLQQLVDSLQGKLLSGVTVHELEPLRGGKAPAGFSILADSEAGPMSACVPPDLATCPECLAEVNQRESRRWRYPFTSCTRCGPRYTIIRTMPYERPQTTMSLFTFCNACGEEYRSARDRRFHAQTNACAACGPQVWAVASDAQANVAARGEEAIQLAVAALRAGRIVALRGIGGYQLLADATDERAVARLRIRKRRPARPLAVLVDSLDAARQWAEVDDLERAALLDPRNPIVLVRARRDQPLAPAVHPGLSEVGLLLPTTPLHALLARDVGRPLVCTSGNREGDPLEYEVDAAERQLADVSDVRLHHDRPIARPVDDSVVRILAGRAVALRLARGLAPLVLPLDIDEPLLAVGGHQKSAAAWSNGVQAVLGPHVGDLESLAVRERFVWQLGDWQRLYAFEPRALVHDLHLGYFATEWARGQSAATSAVQHHHAHVTAVMLEQGWLDREVLGVAWDGTGLGPDGTIWGGEFLVARAASFRRLARLRPFQLPGGEAAIHEPWRIAVALVEQLAPQSAISPLRWADVDQRQQKLIQQVARNPRFSPLTSSVGRLFDAVAALVLDVSHVQFDGQAAMLLEAVADRHSEGVYPLPLRQARPGAPSGSLAASASPHQLAELDWQPLVAGILADRARGVDPGAMAMKFHRALCAGLLEVHQLCPELPVVLGGGVFQNRLLVETIVEAWGTARVPLGWPHAIPPNDGGLAAGQLAVTAARRRQGID